MSKATLLITASLAAIGMFPAQALAQVTRAGPVQYGANDTLRLTQSASHANANVLQTGASFLDLQQTGDWASLVSSQSGNNNAIRAVQAGTAVANIVQTGSRQVLKLHQ